VNPKILSTALAAIVAIVGVILLTSGGDDDAYQVRIVFDDAGGLVENGDVKIGGVVAGRIMKLQVTDDDRGEAIVELKENAAPIGRGARARVRPVNLLGEKYVDLDAGDVRSPEPSGVVIPPGRTSAPVELDDAINILDPDSRARLRILINETGIALGGKGTDLNATLARLPRALDEAEELVKSISDTGKIDRLITDGDRVLAAFNDGRDDLTGMVDSAARTLAVTARLRQDLGRTLDAAPATLTQLRSTLVKLAGTATRLEPAAVELRRTAAPLAATLKSVPGFRSAAAPTLSQVRTVSPNLSRLAREASPTIRRLQPLSDDLVTFSRALDPVTRILDVQTNPLLRVMEGWARTIQIRDGLGHLFRTEVTVDEELLTTLLAQLQPAPTANKRSRSDADDKPSVAARKTPRSTTRRLTPGPDPAPTATARTPDDRSSSTSTGTPPPDPAATTGAPLLDGAVGAVGGALTDLLDSLQGR